jgi:hypothetical protein
MSTVKNLELLYAAAFEGISSFEEMSPLGEYRAPEEASDNAKELSTTILVNVEASAAGDPVFAKITLAVRADGSWTFLAESGALEFNFETSGTLESPKDPGKALEFIDGLNLTYLYGAFEKPTALEAELAAAYAGYLKRLEKAEKRGAKERVEPIVYGTALAEHETLTLVEEPRQTVEELLSELDANSALANLLRQGPS